MLRGYVCVHRMTYSPVYANNKAVWPNMSRRRLRSHYDEPCGDLLVSSSSHTTSESSATHDVPTRIGLQQFVLKCTTRSPALKIVSCLAMLIT